MIKVLIFGVSGFVSKYLVENLIECGYVVVGTECIYANRDVVIRLNKYG